MMRQMRENTKWIMLVTALAFVALMVFEWGMDLTGRSGAAAAGGEIGRVNGEPITYEEYLAVYNNLYQQQSQANEGPIGAAMVRQIEEAAWEQVVMQKLVAQELQRRGISVTDEEIRQAALDAPPEDIMNAPVFQNEQGQFDPQRYQEFLATPAVTDDFLLQLESYYRDIIPRSKLYFQNMAGLTVSDGQLWRMYRDANGTATVEYIAFAPGALVRDGDVTVPESEVRAFYEENRDDFVRPAEAQVRYVSLNRAPTAQDSAAALEQARQFRQQAATQPFEQVALRAGAVDQNTRLYGEQFTVARGQSAPALDRAVFNTAAGQISEPVLTQAGYHLVKVEQRSGDTAQVRQIVVPLELSRQAEDALLDRADSLEAAVETAGLEQAARRLGLQVRTAQLSPALPVLPGVGAVDDGVDWVFEDAEVGEASEVFESPEAYYLLEVVSRRDEGVLSFEEASATIRPALVTKAKIARARERLAEAESAARSGESLQSVAARFGGTVGQAGPFTRGDFVPGLGRVNAAVGAAFGLQPGQTSPLVEAEDQLFLIRTVARDEPAREVWQAQIAEQRRRVLSALAETRWNQLMAALRDNADITDNRDEILNNQGAATAAGGMPLR